MDDAVDKERNASEAQTPDNSEAGHDQANPDSEAGSAAGRSDPVAHWREPHGRIHGTLTGDHPPNRVL